MCGGDAASRVLEPSTAVLIAVNKRYKTRAGVLLTPVGVSRGVV